MYRAGKTLVLSPSDLVTFHETEFGAWMDRYYLEHGQQDVVPAPHGNGICQPDAESDEDRLLRDKGFEHERRYRDELGRAGRRIHEIRRGDDALERTAKSFTDTADVIYQGRLEAQVAPGIVLGGFADFIVRGEDGYEPWDTKLAREAKTAHVLPLCAYADLLGKMGMARSRHARIILGNGQPFSFELRDYFAYYQQLLTSLIAFQSSFSEKAMPHPAMSASHGRWSTYADRVLAEWDHVRGAANIRRPQVQKLERAGITTLSQLASKDEVVASTLSRDVAKRLCAQARLQKEAKGSGRARAELFPVPDGARRGFRLLPPPHALDIFFDMEGDPLLGEGLEYLFGYVADGKFVGRWAHTHEDEKLEFERFVDLVRGRWQTSVGQMHVYHYAAYEIGRMRLLAQRHHTREPILDELLKHDVFVDLYKVVKQAFVIGTPSYSLKFVEKLYREARAGEVQTAMGSVVAYEKWLSLKDTAPPAAATILAEIEHYNEDDCRSLELLLRWLLPQRPAGQEYVPPTIKVEKDSPKKQLYLRAQLLAERLLAEASTSSDPEQARVKRLLAQLCEFHRRDEKPGWWRYFERLQEEPGDLEDDLECIANVRFEGTKPSKKGNPHYLYRFEPTQETKLQPGDGVVFQDKPDHDFSIVELNAEAGTLTLSSKHPPDPEGCVVLKEGFNYDSAIRAVCDYAEGLAPSPVIEALLHRSPPAIGARAPTDTSALAPAGATIEQVCAVVRAMRTTVLSIQGPPGTGKTYTAARVVASLLADKKRVGVMAHSHKAIMNVLAEVVRVTGLPRDSIHKLGGDEDDDVDDLMKTDRIRKGQNADIDKSAAQLVGATAYAFGRPAIRGVFDYLIVDEAGQVSLANAIAGGLAAKNLVLVGDHMQLPQPTQGSHPGESALSALEYSLVGHQTVPRHLGILLEETRRLHPSICGVISDAIYDGRLHAHADTSRRRVLARPGREEVETGIVFVPVPHEGCSQRSTQEAETVRSLVAELLDRDYLDGGGSPRRLRASDILCVAPFNMQVRALERVVPNVEIGTVDRFQGREAPVVIVSLTSSTIEDTPRGIEFLLNRNRLNVAVTRAKCLVYIVGSPALMAARVGGLENVRLVNFLCRLAECSPRKKIDFL